MASDRSRSPRRREDDRQRGRDRHYSSRDDPRRRSRSRSRDRKGDDDKRRRRRRDDGSDDDHGKRRRDKDSRKRESSVERRDRKAAEKAARKAEKRAIRDEEERRAAAEISIYSAQDNPFHDADLGSKFDWTKKREKEKTLGISAEEAAKRDAARRAEAIEELEKLNRRRAEREKEMELREAEQSRMAQLAESAQMAGWIAREDEFQLEQAQKRAEIRVRENRAKPIDLLALNLKWGNPDAPAAADGAESGKPKGFEDEEDDGAGLEIDLDEPYTIFDNLTLEETQELQEDIKMHLALEKNARNIDFWRCLKVVCDDALRYLSASRNAGHDALRNQDAIKADVTRLLAGKPFEKLMELENSIEAKLASSGPHDPEYWQGLLREVKVWKAKARLRAMHEVVLRNRLEQLRRKQRDEAVKVQKELADTLVHPSAPAKLSAIPQGAAATSEADAEAEESAEEYEREMSPVPFSRVHPDDHALAVVFPDDELRSLISDRRKILQTRFVPKPRLAASDEDEGVDRDALAEQLYKQEAEKGLDEEEELFDMEAEMSRQSYNWEDKYRPRKPRYFNKVHTGYEWNKYNQTHYDSDNPPPKVVQGYKFNIFYPDLIDKSRAPTYRIIKRKDTDDVVTLLFTAGPPYEDIAFTIVNKQWEHSHKRGFRSTFDRGVLQLHFSLARIHYRK